MSSTIPGLIDVWDIATFDKELTTELRAKSNLICAYVATENENFLERECSDHLSFYPTNQYAGAYLQFIEYIDYLMMARTIRAWHYTRLTDMEIEAIQKHGVHVSTLETARRRLGAQVSAGLLSKATADALLAASPLHNQIQHQARSNRFWMTSHPTPTDDGSVELLLSNWGGEVIYFWLKEQALKELVGRLGQPRVLEVAAPLNTSRRSYAAAEAVVAAWARMLGNEPDKDAFDLYVTEALGPDAVISIHTAGDEDFAALGRGYPTRFTDHRQL